MKCQICGKETDELYHVGLDHDMDCYKVDRCRKCAEDFRYKILNIVLNK